MSKHFRIRPRCRSIKMGRNTMIGAFAALLIFFTLTQAAPPPTTDGPIEICLRSIDDAQRVLEEKMSLVEERMTDISRSGIGYRSATYLDLLGANASTRFDTLRRPNLRWMECSYKHLLKLASTDNRWRSVCLAHEHYIIALAQYDMKRLIEYLKYYTSRNDVSANNAGEIRLKQYEKFILHHQNMISCFLYGPGGLLHPMATSTNYVDRPTLDLLSQHRADDSDAPPSGTSDRINRPVFDFLGQAAEQELGISLGTHYSEGYEAPTLLPGDISLSLSINPHRAAESSTHSHDNRNRGKMPMHDDSSAPSCYPYYPYHSPDGEHHRR
ncbi:hypothetical protein SeLEV6574_g06912 [Synchytrium endobioticum]|uniref:Uncharacterized protein n=1 Tax=Synchytrium endobioticum TaxID=286115 RepID=A0A507CFS2_9FUNG|nr:hypothetical protein SeLEV6574_g06912 [Synchytrium endobioticum]